MTAMTPERMDEIRERAESATEGPWRSHDFGHAGEEEPSSIVVHVGRFDHSDLRTYDTETAVAWVPRWERQESDNATFIAHARTDVPDLLAHVDHLTAENARLREGVEALHHSFILCEECPWSDCDDPGCEEDVGTGGHYHPHEPIRPACVTCRHDDGEPADWPCETARLLNPPTEGETRE